MVTYEVFIILVISFFVLIILFPRFSKVDDNWIKICEECSSFIKRQPGTEDSSQKAKIEGVYKGYLVSVSADLIGSFEGGAVWPCTKILVTVNKPGVFQLKPNRQRKAKKKPEISQESFPRVVECTPDYLLQLVIQSDTMRRRIMETEFSQIRLERGVLSVFVDGVIAQADQVKSLINLLCDIDKCINRGMSHI